MEPSSTQSRRSVWKDLPSKTQLAMGLLAIAVVQLFRPESSPIVIVAFETLFYVAVPVLLLWFFGKRFDVTKSGKSWSRNVFFQLVGILYTLTPVLSQLVMRSVGFGDAYEVVAIMCILNLAWFFTVFSRIARSENASFVLNSSVALFVCFATQDTFVYVAAFAYAITALWWLLENYWNRLLPKKLDAETTSLPIKGFAFSLSIIFLVAAGVIAAAAGPMSSVISIPGFMPSSGGENGYDDMFARSGVGDGEMLTTGDNATAVGAVDTDQFIEDKKPSIYDVVSEKYDGPVRVKKKMTASQSLSEIAKHVHKVKNAEQSGKTFRTVRKSNKIFERELEDRISDALFFVEGKVPTRFRVDCFQHFDGWDWTKVEDERSKRFLPNIRLEKHQGAPWFVLDSLLPNFLLGDLHHQIKIMRLESESLPASPFLKAWHITKVDNEGLFKWNDAGLVKIRNDTIPAQTVIDVISHEACLYSLRVEELDPFKRLSEPSLTQIPSNSTETRIKELARSLTNGIKPGWRQVEAITNHLRSRYTLNESDVPGEDSNDTVGWFLDNGGGPSYLFATTAVQLLRAAGYQTRLATGFVVENKDYIRKSRQSVVTHENYHMWPEVCFDGSHWIPVEPTPGYSNPIGYSSIWARAMNLIDESVLFVKSNPVLSGVFLILGIATVLLRRYWMAFSFWCYWFLFGWGNAGRKLKLTRQLIDTRLWLFGVPRPSFVAIRDWFQKIDQELPNDFFDLWNQIQFCSSASVESKRQQIDEACRNIVSRMSLSKIKEFATQEK